MQLTLVFFSYYKAKFSTIFNGIPLYSDWLTEEQIFNAICQNVRIVGSSSKVNLNRPVGDSAPRAGLLN